MFDINTRYNFSTYAPGILGGNYTNAKVLSIMNYVEAVKYTDVATIHTQVYPSLPPNTPKDYRDLTYVLFELENGRKVVFATIWIDATTVVVAGRMDIVIRVRSVTNQDVTKIRDALTTLGYLNVDITTEG